MVSLLSGNSRILLTLDERGSWAELYYPYPGLHQQLLQSRLGLYDETANKFVWADREGQSPVQMRYLEQSNAASTQMNQLGVEMTLDDMVHPNRDIIIRRITLRNGNGSARRLRVFHYQSLNIAGTLYQDTAYWDAGRKTINHYKGSYYFQLQGHPDFDAVTCGEHTLKGLRGTYVDAEDGALDGNVISHGAADSVVQWNVPLAPGESRSVHLLLMAARSRSQVNELHDALQGRNPELYTAEAISYCNNWSSSKEKLLAPDLSAHVGKVYRRSLFVMRDCQAVNGSIVASPDSRTLKSGGDTYNYCWWRDGAYICRAMADVGYDRGALAFLKFAAACQEPEGYFLHRHFPDGSVGSTWHPPPFIQIDQTASVIDAAWHYYRRTGHLDELLDLWPMVRSAADFLMEFVGPNGLPLPSFDLWEEHKAVSAYGTGSVISGLRAAERIGQALGKRAGFWADAAARMQRAALDLLWNEDKQIFLKSLDPRDDTIDASALVAGLVPPENPRFAQLVDTIEKRLWVHRTGGIARYENDTYYGHENGWIICTLWLARARLALGDVRRCRDLIEWVAEQAGPTHLLPEQIASDSGMHTSVTPLVWSHSTFAEVVAAYSVAKRALSQTQVAFTPTTDERAEEVA